MRYPLYGRIQPGVTVNEPHLAWDWSASRKILFLGAHAFHFSICMHLVLGPKLEVFWPRFTMLVQHYEPNWRIFGFDL